MGWQKPLVRLLPIREVDVLPTKNVKDITQYKAIVAGSAINGGVWLPEAMHFLQYHKTELNQKPFAAFLVCMTLAMKNAEQYRKHVDSWLGPIRALVHPFSEGLFAGGLDINKIPSASDRLKFRLSMLFGIWEEGDYRNWNAIRAWSENLHSIISK